MALANRHGGVDNQEPEADKRGKVVEHVVGVHEESQRAAEEVQAEEHGGGAVERKVLLGEEEESVAITGLEQVCSDKESHQDVNGRRTRAHPVVDEDDKLHPALPFIGLVSRKERLVGLDNKSTLLASWGGRRLAEGGNSNHDAGNAEKVEALNRPKLRALGHYVGSVSIVAHEQSQDVDAGLHVQEAEEGLLPTGTEIEQLAGDAGDQVQHAEVDQGELHKGLDAVIRAASSVVRVRLHAIELGVASQVQQNVGSGLGHAVDDVEASAQRVDPGPVLALDESRDGPDGREVPLALRLVKPVLHFLDLHDSSIRVLDACGVGSQVTGSSGGA